VNWFARCADETQLGRAGLCPLTAQPDATAGTRDHRREPESKTKKLNLRVVQLPTCDEGGRLRRLRLLLNLLALVQIGFPGQRSAATNRAGCVHRAKDLRFAARNRYAAVYLSPHYQKVPCVFTLEEYTPDSPWLSLLIR
jgi:hypothetical protein